DWAEGVAIERRPARWHAAGVRRLRGGRIEEVVRDDPPLGREDRLARIFPSLIFSAGRRPSAIALRAPRTSSINASGSDGSSSPRHATCWSGRTSTSLRL